MKNLTYNEVTRINDLIAKIQQRVATAAEMREFLSLIRKSGQNNWTEFQHFIQTAGYASAEDFQKQIYNKNAQELFEGLVKIGFAIIIAYGLSKLFGKK